MIDKALIIAKQAHHGQVDKAGVNYLEHVMKVYEMVNTVDEKIVALLHDVIEDSEVTLSDLIRQGFSNKIVSAVEAITKKRNEEYKNYLQRVKRNEIARIVKQADLIHNSDLSRLRVITAKDVKRSEKYKSSIRYLLDEN